MKHTAFAIALALLVASTAFCASPKKENKILTKSENLVAQKKYWSAYQLLDNFDPENTNSTIFLKKVDIVQNYFLFNIMNQIYCLDDLPADKSVEELRGNEEASGCHTVMLPIDSIAERLLLKEPSNALIYKCLGDFYVSVARRFGEQWIDQRPEADKMIRARSYYLKANNLGLNNAEISANIAESYLHEGLFANARRYFAKAIDLSTDTSANYHYNMAVAHYLDTDSGSFELAARHSAIAARHYPQGSDYQYDALYMLGMSQLRMEQPTKAIATFKKANSISPNRNYLLFSMIEAQLKARAPEWQTTAETYTTLFANNTDLVNRLPELFLQTDSTKLNELKNILINISKETADELATANLNLAAAQTCLYLNHKTEARDLLLKAKEYFKRDTDEYDNIIGYINELLKHAK